MCTYCVAALLTLATLATAIVPFGCHGDVCNVGGQDQFCSAIFNICRNCEEIRDECYHPILPQNCTPYCVGFLLKMEMKKEMEKPCPALSNITNGDHNGSTETSHTSGTTVITTCHQKFHIDGHSQTICGEFGIWSPALPSCQPDDLRADVINLTTPLAVVCAFLALGYTLLGIICWQNKCKRRERNRRQLQRDSTPRNSLDDESNELETTLILTKGNDVQENDTSHKDKAHVKPKMRLPPRKMPDKEVKQSDSVVPVPVGTAAQAAKSNGVATPLDYGEFQAEKPAPNWVEARCRPEHLIDSVRFVSPPNTSEMYGPAQEVYPVPYPLYAHAGKRQTIPTDDNIRPGLEAPPNLTVPKVTVNVVQPTSTNTATPTVGAEGPPFVTNTGHHPQENGDYKNDKLAIN